jgi:hypothetical protein
VATDSIVTPIIVGSGRSGTTWVQDVVAQANGYATAFEPLHPVAIPAMAAYAGRYLRAEGQCDELEAFLGRVFSGHVRDTWITYRVRPDRLAFRALRITDPRAAYEWLWRWRKFARHYVRYRRDRGKPVLVKFIRANLMLPWLASHFNVRIAAIVRHPGAVVESKMRLGGDDWEPEVVIERYRGQPGLMEELPRAHERLSDEHLTPAGRHALIWCIENKLLVERAAEWGIVLTYYEDLLDDSTGDVWQSLVEGLGLNHAPDRVSRSKASQQASLLTANSGYESGHCGGWRSRLSPAQIDEIQQMLNVFEIDQYDMNSMLPCRRRANGP